jgi:hypothetical protein
MTLQYLLYIRRVLICKICTATSVRIETLHFLQYPRLYQHSLLKTANHGEGLVRTPAVRSAYLSQSLAIRRQRNDPQVSPTACEGSAVAGHAERCYSLRVSVLHSRQYVFSWKVVRPSMRMSVSSHFIYFSSCLSPSVNQKLPHTFSPEYKAASQAYMRYHNMNPIYGVSSK